MTHAPVLRRFLPALLTATGIAALATVGIGSDHIDAPKVTGTSKDIADLYVFENPTHTDRVVFVLTTAGLKPPVKPTDPLPPFNPNVLYQVKLDTNGDAAEDQVIQATFSGPKGRQRVTITGPATPKTVGSRTTLASGPSVNYKVGKIFGGGGTIRAYTGLVDDPFFIDLADLKAILSGKQTGFVSPGVDALSGTNVLAIVVEVAKSALGADQVGVWATTSEKIKGTGDYRQLDRVGIPAIATVFIPTSEKNAYNSGIPSNDAATYRKYVRNFATNVAKKSAKEADGLAAALMPDMLPYNRTKPANFAALNGRRLSDDAVDVALSLLFKGIGALETDQVNANEVPFRKVFPWLAFSHKK